MNDISRRTLIERAAAVATGMAATALTPERLAAVPSLAPNDFESSAPRVRFGVIGVNHAHIYGQVDAVQRGGGELVRFHASEGARARSAIRAPLPGRAPEERRASDPRGSVDPARGVVDHA